MNLSNLFLPWKLCPVDTALLNISQIHEVIDFFLPSMATNQVSLDHIVDHAVKIN